MKTYRIVADENDLNDFFFESTSLEECERMIGLAMSAGCEGEIVEIEIQTWHKQIPA